MNKKIKRTNVEKLIRQYERRQWVINCNTLEDVNKLFAILAIENFSFNDKSKVSVNEADAYASRIDSCYFEIIKGRKLNFQKTECYPYYHWKIISFEDFYVDYCNSKLADSQKLFDDHKEENKLLQNAI